MSQADPFQGVRSFVDAATEYKKRPHNPGARAVTRTRDRRTATNKKPYCPWTIRGDVWGCKTWALAFSRQNVNETGIIAHYGKLNGPVS